MSLADDLELIGEHIGDDQPNLPAGSKNTLLLAAKALRESDRIIDGYKTWVDEQDDRIKELEAIVAKLPHTADGVPVVPGSVVWHPDYLWRSWEVDYEGDYGEYTVAINPDRKGNEWETAFVTECYSNHAAAEKASKA